jgi:hypothetical protein
MNKIYPFLLAIVISSCTTNIRYIGQSHPPTSEVDIFVSPESIKRPYDYIGKGYLGYFKNPVKIQQKSEKLARKKGADAVLIMDYHVPNTGTQINSIFQTDSVARSTVTTASTTVQSVHDTGYSIFFLKYKAK